MYQCITVFIVATHFMHGDRLLKSLVWTNAKILHYYPKYNPFRLLHGKTQISLFFLFLRFLFFFSLCLLEKKITLQLIQTNYSGLTSRTGLPCQVQPVYIFPLRIHLLTISKSTIQTENKSCDQLHELICNLLQTLSIPESQTSQTRVQAFLEEQQTQSGCFL